MQDLTFRYPLRQWFLTFGQALATVNGKTILRLKLLRLKVKGFWQHNCSHEIRYSNVKMHANWLLFYITWIFISLIFPYLLQYFANYVSVFKEIEMPLIIPSSIFTVTKRYMATSQRQFSSLVGVLGQLLLELHQTGMHQIAFHSHLQHYHHSHHLSTCCLNYKKFLLNL